MNPPSKKDTASDESTEASASPDLPGRVRLLSNPFFGGFQASAGASPSHFRDNQDYF